MIMRNKPPVRNPTFLSSKMAFPSPNKYQLSVLKWLCRNFLAKHAKHEHNKIVLIPCKTIEAIYSTRGRKDGQAVGRRVLRRRSIMAQALVKRTWNKN